MTGSKSSLLPLTGIVFVALMITGFLVGGEPPEAASHSPAEIVKWYTDNKGSAQLGVLILSIGVVVLVYFASYLKSVLERGDGENGLLSRVAFAGIIVFAVGGAIDGSILFAISEAVDDIGADQVQTLQALWDNDFIPFAIGLSLFISACGLSIVLHKSLPVWLGWVALVLAAVGVTPIGFVSFIGTGVWILVVSVMLLISERSVATPVVE